MNNNLLIFNKHSLKYVGFSFLAFVIFLIIDLDLFALVTFAFMVFSAYVFRNPEKLLLSDEHNSVVSPVDGTIIDIEDIEDAQYAYKVDINSNYFDVSFLRAPFNAKVESLNIVRGARLGKNSKLFESLNEYVNLVFIDNNDNKIKVVHKLTRSFAPLFLDIAVNDALIKSSSYGVMLSGVTTIYLPHSFNLDTKVGNKVSASETLLGSFAS